MSDPESSPELDGSELAMGQFEDELANLEAALSASPVKETPVLKIESDRPEDDGPSHLSSRTSSGSGVRASTSDRKITASPMSRKTNSSKVGSKTRSNIPTATMDGQRRSKLPKAASATSTANPTRGRTMQSGPTSRRSTSPSGRNGRSSSATSSSGASALLRKSSSTGATKGTRPHSDYMDNPSVHEHRVADDARNTPSVRATSPARPRSRSRHSVQLGPREPTVQELLDENEWLMAQLAEVRIFHRENTHVNYDHAMKYITEERAATGRWSEQRNQDRKEAQLKKDVLAFFSDNGVPPEAGSWQRLLLLWHEHLDHDRDKSALRARVHELETEVHELLPFKENDAHLQATIANLRHELSAMDAHNHKVNEDFTDLSSELERERELTHTVQNQLSDARADGVKHTAQIAELEGTVAELQHALAEHERALDHLRAEATSREEAFTAEQAAQGSGFSRAQQQWSVQQRALQDELAAETRRCTALQKELDTVDANFKRLAQEHDKKHEQLVEFQQQFDDEIGMLQRTISKQKHDHDTSSLTHEEKVLQLQEKIQELQQENSEHVAEIRNAWHKLQDTERVATMSETDREKLRKGIAQLEDDHARTVATLTAALAAKEDKLHSVRLTFDEERHTLQTSLAAEKEVHAAAERRHRDAVERLQREHRAGQAQAETTIASLQQRLERSLQSVHDAEAHHHSVSKSMEADQRRIQDEFGRHVAETEKVFEDVVAQLKDDHAAELQQVLRAKAEVEAHEQHAQETILELNAAINAAHDELVAVRDAHALSQSTLSHTAREHDHVDRINHEKLVDITGKYRALARAYDTATATIDALRSDGAAATRAHDSAVMALQQSEHDKVQQYGALMNKLQVRVADQSDECERLQRTVAALERDKEHLHAEVDRLRDDLKAESNEHLTKLEQLSGSADQDRRQIRERLNEADRRFDELVKVISGNFADALRVGAGDAVSNGAHSSDSIMTVAKSPELQVAAMVKALKHKHTALQTCQASLQAQTKDTEDAQLQVKLLREELSRGASATTDAESRHADALAHARAEQQRFDEMLASVRQGFDKEKSNFVEQIAAARQQTQAVTDELSAARRAEQSTAETMRDLEQRNHLARQTNAGLEAQVNVVKQQLAESERQYDSLRADVAQTGSDLAVARASLNAEIGKREEAAAREAAARGDLDMAEQACEKLREAVGAAAELQRKTDSALHDAQLKVAEYEQECAELHREVDVLRDALREESAAKKQVAEELAAATDDIVTLRNALAAAEVEHGAASKARTKLDATRRQLEDELSTREAQCAQLHEELDAARAQAKRHDRVLRGKCADAEAQLALAEQRAEKSSQGMLQLEQKNRKLRDQLGQLQVESEMLKESESSAQRNLVRLRAAVQQLEAEAAQLRRDKTTLAANDTLMRSRVAGAEHTSVLNASRMVASVRSQLDQQASVRKELERTKTENAAATQRDVERRANNMQGLNRSLNTSGRLPSSAKGDVDVEALVTSTPKK
eukprot:m.1265900 g.1265900  ORF g.1265900 m.1265900 type:complete len:1502 (+) comp24738_c0_seq5:196-4701(+)